MQDEECELHDQYGEVKLVFFSLGVGGWFSQGFDRPERIATKEDRVCEAN